MMKRLLVSHDRGFGAALKFDLRNLRQEFRFSVSARMTITTGIYGWCTWVFFQQFGRQGCCAVRRPGGLVRRMLGSFSCRLSCVVAFNTG